MLNSTRLTRLALAVLAAGALAGCGKTPSTAAPAPLPGVVDDVMTRSPLAGQHPVADQEQATREQQTRRPETTKVGAPSNETGG